MTDRPGRQLSSLLHALGAGRGALPAPLPAPVGATGQVGLAGEVGAVQRVVALFGAARPVQADPTTCGSAALVVLAAAGDPRLARWLETGETDGRGGPEAASPATASPATGWGMAPELAWLDRSVRERAPSLSLMQRFAALQQAVKVRSTRRALLGLPWPSRLGTPPWGAARVARFGTIRYCHRLVVDARPAQSGPLLERATAAARAGIPVPLYTGGDTRAGPSAAVPRHVVVLTSPDGSALEVYEPSTGRMLAIAEEELARGGVRRPAYGNWSHVTWALLPTVD